MRTRYWKGFHQLKCLCCPRCSSLFKEVERVAGESAAISCPPRATFVGRFPGPFHLPEQSFEQRGQHKHFRWEIPYQYLVRIEEKPDSGASANGVAATAAPKSAAEAQVASKPGDSLSVPPLPLRRAAPPPSSLPPPSQDRLTNAVEPLANLSCLPVISKLSKEWRIIVLRTR